VRIQLQKSCKLFTNINYWDGFRSISMSEIFIWLYISIISYPLFAKKYRKLKPYLKYTFQTWC